MVLTVRDNGSYTLFAEKKIDMSKSGCMWPTACKARGCNLRLGICVERTFVRRGN